MLFVLYSPFVPNQACQYWYYCQVWVSVPILRKKKLWLSWHDQAGMCYYLPLLPKSPTQTDVFHFLKASYWSTLLALQVNTEVTYLDCNNTCMLFTSREVRFRKNGVCGLGYRPRLYAVLTYQISSVSVVKFMVEIIKLNKLAKNMQVYGKKISKLLPGRQNKIYLWKIVTKLKTLCKTDNNTKRTLPAESGGEWVNTTRSCNQSERMICRIPPARLLRNN